MNSTVLPKNVMKLPGFAAAMDNREIIVDYLVSQEGSVKLSDKQEELLRRWHEADDLMRSVKYTSRQVANMLVNTFRTEGNKYSIATAWRDMEDARFVFGTSRKANKPYLLALHIERIESAIVICQSQGKRDLLPKLFECYSNALKQLPDDVAKDRNPSAIIFNITTNNYKDLVTTEMTAEQAQAIVVKRMAEWGKEVEDIMHEEVPGE